MSVLELKGLNLMMIPGGAYVHGIAWWRHGYRLVNTWIQWCRHVCGTPQRNIPTNMHNVAVMLWQRRRRWLNITATLWQRDVFAAPPPSMCLLQAGCHWLSHGIAMWQAVGFNKTANWDNLDLRKHESVWMTAWMVTAEAGEEWAGAAATATAAAATTEATKGAAAEMATETAAAAAAAATTAAATTTTWAVAATAEKAKREKSNCKCSSYSRSSPTLSICDCCNSNVIFNMLIPLYFEHKITKGEKSMQGRVC